MPAADPAEALTRHPALGLLAVAVPMHIAELRALTTDQRLGIARECGQVIAEHGDDLMFRSKPGRPAAAFNNLARGLAAAAYQPGGITFAGMHFCTDHGACQAAVELP
jgi:hypothetical protein